MKRFLFCLLFIIPMITGYAQKKIAILETTSAENNISASKLLMIGSCIETGIVNNGIYEAYSRSQLASIIKEHNFQRSGLTKESEIRRLGGLSGVDYVLVTKAALLDTMIFVTAKALNVETGEYDISENALMEDNAESIMVACNRLAQRIRVTTDTTQKETNLKELKINEAAKKLKPVKRDRLFHPSFGFGAELATNLSLTEFGIPLQFRLLKPNNRFNIVAGVRFGSRGKFMEEDFYDKKVDSTFFWKLNHFRLSPFVTFRYGSEIYVAAGLRMDYNFGYSWHYGQRQYNLTHSSSSSYTSNTSNTSLSHTVRYQQKGIVEPISLTTRFELGFPEEDYDLVIFVDWSVTPTFTEETINNLISKHPYNRLSQESTLSNVLQSRIVFGIAMNLYL